MVGLEEKANTLVKNLSGGQKQRLLIAVALVSNAQILFLDEPTGSLDPHARRKLWDLILKFRAENRTVILTTHSMEEAEFLCDRVAIIDRGNIIACDTPEKLVDTYVSEKAICFTTKDRTVDIEKISSFLEVITVEEKLVGGAKEIKVHTNDCDTTINRLSKGELLNCSWSNLRIEGANLEDVFLRLTGRSILEEV